MTRKKLVNIPIIIVKGSGNRNRVRILEKKKNILFYSDWFKFSLRDLEKFWIE